MGKEKSKIEKEECQANQIVEIEKLVDKWK
jgi:hypothetical protein